MKEYYNQYFADFGPHKDNFPVTVCTLFMPKTFRFARGVAICGADDKCDMEEGKRIAKHKALRGLKRRGDEFIVRKEALSILITTDCPFRKGVDHNPTLTHQEVYHLVGRKAVFKCTHIVNTDITMDFEVGGMVNGATYTRQLSAVELASQLRPHLPPMNEFSMGAGYSGGFEVKMSTICNERQFKLINTLFNRFES